MKGNKTAHPLAWKEARKILVFLEGVEQYHHLLLMAVGFFTGFRIGDMLVLKYEDFQNEVLDIRKRKVTTQPPIPIAAELHRIVRLCQLRLRGRDSSYLFIRIRFPSKRPISKAAAITRIREAFEYAGIKNVQLSGHTLRKTFALRYFNLLRQKQGEYRAISELANLLNHANTEVTRQYIEWKKPIIAKSIFDNFN